MSEWSGIIAAMHVPATVMMAVRTISASAQTIQNAIAEQGTEAIVHACSVAVTIDTSSRPYCEQIIAAIPQYALTAALRKHVPHSDVACAFFLPHITRKANPSA